MDAALAAPCAVPNQAVWCPASCHLVHRVHEGEDAAHAGGGRAAPSPRSAAPAAANGWADGGGRPPRGKPPHSQWQALSPRAPGSARHYPHSQEDHPFSDGAAPPFRGGGAAGRHNEVSESEAAAMSARGDLPATLYPGSADRSNSAIAEYLRNQGTPQFSFPTLLGAAGSPGQAALLSAGAPRVSPGAAGDADGHAGRMQAEGSRCWERTMQRRLRCPPLLRTTRPAPPANACSFSPLLCTRRPQYLPPLSLDNRSAQSMAAVGGGAPAGGSAAGAAGAGQQLVVGSYPANITAQVWRQQQGQGQHQQLWQQQRPPAAAAAAQSVGLCHPAPPCAASHDSHVSGRCDG